MAYDKEKYDKLRSLEVPRPIALALADDDSPVGIPYSVQAATVAEIADPATATAEDVAEKVNEIISSLRNASLMA